MRPWPAGNTCSLWRPPTSCSVRSSVACGRSPGCSCGRHPDDSDSTCWGAWNAVTREPGGHHQYDGGEQRDHVRIAAGDRGPGTGRASHSGPGQRPLSAHALVQGLAKELGIALLFLPSYSPNLNLIERLWRFMKRKAAYVRYHPTFADFRAAIEEVLGGIPRRLTRTS